MDRFVRHAAGYAPVHDVDRAADRLAAEQKHGGAMQHLDPLRRQRIDGDGMIGRGVGDVDRADAVREHADTDALKARSEEHTSELQSLMRISYAVFCLKKKKNRPYNNRSHRQVYQE